MVPKVLVKRGRFAAGARNGVGNTGGIEHKMGIKAQATCVLNFDDAIGVAAWPQSREAAETGRETVTPAAGMAGMFGIMNSARVAVGVQGIALGDVAYQNGYAYAHERRVGRALTGAQEPEQERRPGDCSSRRQEHAAAARARFVEGARALASWTGLQQSIAHSVAARRGKRSRTAGRPDDADPESLLHRHGF